MQKVCTRLFFLSAPAQDPGNEVKFNTTYLRRTIFPLPAQECKCSSISPLID